MLQIHSSFVKSFPLLSKDQEKELFEEYQTNKSVKIRNKIVQHNIGLVYKIAGKYNGVPDLANEGMLGLIKAVERFDLEKEVKFSTYAVQWIRCYILDYILKNRKVVSIDGSSGAKKVFFNLSKTIDKLRNEGKDATSEAIAERLNVNIGDVEVIRAYFQKERSMNEPLSNSVENAASFEEVLADDAPLQDFTFDSKVEEKRLTELVSSFRQKLNRPVLVSIFDNCMLGEATLQSVGLEFDLSRERIRQLSNTLHQKFKAHCLASGYKG